jgi:uncharacterized CHY-type Zn-finger protein
MKIILQCNRCKKLYAVKQYKWEKLLERWGTIDHAVQNYICKKCELSVTVPDYKEKPSQEEIELLSQTIDGRPFNPDAVISFIKKVGILRKLWNYSKVFVVDEKKLKEYHRMWTEQQKEKEQGNQK